MAMTDSTTTASLEAQQQADVTSADFDRRIPRLRKVCNSCNRR